MAHSSAASDAAPERTRMRLMWLRHTAPLACTLRLGQRPPLVDAGLVEAETGQGLDQFPFLVGEVGDHCVGEQVD